LEHGHLACDGSSADSEPACADPRMRSHLSTCTQTPSALLTMRRRLHCVGLTMQYGVQGTSEGRGLRFRRQMRTSIICYRLTVWSEVTCVPVRGSKPVADHRFLPSASGHEGLYLWMFLQTILYCQIPYSAVTSAWLVVHCLLGDPCLARTGPDCCQP
jgi:hypothetical protein